MRRIALILVPAVALATALLFVAPRSGAPQRARITSVGAREPGEPPPAVDERTPELARGRVLDDATGEGVSCARLTLYRVPRMRPDVQAVVTLVTDETGRLPSALPDDEHDGLLVIEATGYPLQAHEFDPKEQDVRLGRGKDETLTIVGDGGGPAAGAEIDMFADRWSKLRLASARADSRGRVTLRVAGEAWLLVRSSGHSYERLHIDPPAWELPETLPLAREFTIGGRVLDTAGQPVPGASVHLRQGAHDGWSRYDQTLAVGSDGGFLFRGVHESACLLDALADGYVEASENPVPGDERLRVVLHRAASASGIVVMPDGGPAVGAEVGLEGDYPSATTDTEGRFHIGGLAPARQAIRAVARDDMRASIEIVPAEGEAIAGLRLALRPSPRSHLRVRVSDENGSVMPEVRVWSQPGSMSLTDRNGVATLAVREPAGTEATVRTNVMPPLCDATIRAVTTATPDERPPLEMVVHQRVLVLLDARAPDGTHIPGAWAIVHGDDAFEAWRERGWWLDPADAYKVTVGARGFHDLDMEGWSPRSAGNIVVASLRPSASVRGRVVDSEGAPMHTIGVAIDRRMADWGTTEVSCELDGSFLIDGLREGKATLVVWSIDGTATARVPVATRSGQVTDAGTVVLVPRVDVMGRIVDSAGSALGGARVELRTALPGESEGTCSRSDGTYRVSAPASVACHLIVEKRGFGTVRVAIAPAPARPIGDIVMPVPGAVLVTVEDATPKGDLLLNLWWREEPPVLVDARAIARTYGNEDLAPGRYVARLWAGDNLSEQEFAIVAGQTTNVTFRLAR